MSSDPTRKVEISEAQAKALVAVIKMHEGRRPSGFTADDYTDEQWDAITDLIVKIA